MSKWDKLLTRICALSKDLRFDELRKVLESYGYVMNAPKGGSSHYTFRKAGCQPITIPKHEPIKKVYVEMVKQIVESEKIHIITGLNLPLLIGLAQDLDSDVSTDELIENAIQMGREGIVDLKKMIEENSDIEEDF